MTNSIMDAFSNYGIPITLEKAEKLLLFYNELIFENEKVNLTSITDFNDVIIKHFLDSAAFLKTDFQTDNKSIIDVGTGAGFPGIVLGILVPEFNVTLLETLGKRCRFLENVSSKLGLENISVINGRAEDYANNSDFREKFDYSTSRAVANLNTLSEYLLPFVRTDGFMVAYKGKGFKEEILAAQNAISILGGEFFLDFTYNLPNDIGQRALVCVRKVENTSSKYPRKAGIPTKRPL